MALAQTPPKKKIITRAVVVGFIGLVVGFTLGYAVKPTIELVNAQSIRENTTKYTFIHPLLAVSRPDSSVPSPQYAPLAKSINDYIHKQKVSGAVTSASVYFINYGKGGSFAINENEGYDPASLLKVVIMVAYLKQSDEDPSILHKGFLFTSELAKIASSAVPFESSSTLVAGETYDTSVLIDKMITDSDNGAMTLLLSNLNSAYLNDVYTELGLKGPSDDQIGYTISAKDYSLFFRILYNGTYLTNSSSEKALSILSKATFKDGLVAGLPAGTIVAHKFGEHASTSAGSMTINSIELHDCGIVYSPSGAYLLCVMTKGSNLDALKATISKISGLVYSASASK